MKKQLLFIYLIISCSLMQLYAQNTPAIEWQKSLGGTEPDKARCIQQTTDGGFIVAGLSNSDDGDVTGNNGNSDYWIVKLDSSGNIMWEKSMGGTSSDEAYSIQQISDGGYIIAGFSKSNDEDVSGNHGLRDFWIVGLDASGNIDLKKSLGGSDLDEAHSVQQTTDGGFIIAGFSNSADGDVTSNHGETDFWIVKLDISGNPLWQKSLGGADQDKAYSIQQTTDGGFVTAGYSKSDSGDVSENHGGYDYWIVKLDATGNPEWEKSLGGSEDDYAFSVQQTADGGFAVAGSSKSLDGDVSGHHGSTSYLDGWMVKLDPSGNLEWQKSLGGSVDDEIYSMQQTANGGFIVSGYSLSTDGDVTGNHGDEDFWVVSLDSSGAIEWQKSMGGTDYDASYSIQQTTSGEYIVLGSSASTDGDVSGNHGEEDYWMVKLSCGALQIFYADADSDGYGNANESVTLPACPTPAGYVFDTTDCDDTNPNINPAAQEILFNSLDDDCDGYIDEFGTGSSFVISSDAVFSLFPNPSHGEFIVYLQLDEQQNTEVKIEVLNPLGQIALAKTGSLVKGKLEEEIKLNDATNGIYLVRIILNDQVYSGQIVSAK